MEVVTSLTPSAADQRLGAYHWGGVKAGTTYAYPVRIIAYSAEAWDNTHTGAYMTFLTCPTGGSTTATERMRISAGGNVGIANTNPGALLDIGTAGTTLGVIRLQGNTSGYCQLQPTAAAGNVTITFPAVAGTVALAGAYSASGDVACSGYVTMKDSSGNDRKFMICA